MNLLLFFFASLALASAEETPAEEFSSANQLFTQDVYNQLLLDNKDNILVSPFSAETLLALTQSGAKGVTAAEVRTVLHLASTEEETEMEFKSVLPTIHSNYVSLVTANKIYVENNFPIKEDFKRVASDVYQASFQNIEFSESQAAAAEINKWVEEETDDKIKDLVNPDDLSEDTRVVLVNALYFKANWTVPFAPYYSDTRFYTSTQTINAEMMRIQVHLFNHYDSTDLDAQIVEIPFVGGEATMTFVLPNQKEGIALLEKQMSTVLTKPKYQERYVQVVLPKFRIESTIDIKDLLTKLGVRNLFGIGADLSGMAGSPGELFISQAKQKTYIDVNESGVEAAAATEAGGTITEVPPTPSRIFIADHPFMFYIKFQDIVLFEGRVLVPKYGMS